MIGFNRARRFLVQTIGLIVLATSAPAFAQSISIGPAPAGGNRISTSNSGFPNGGLTSSVFGAGGQIQRGALAFGAASLTATSGNITVLSSASVSVTWLGGNGNVATGCTTVPNCDQSYLTWAVVDATHITVTATRAEQDGAITPAAAYQVMDLSPTLVDAVYHGTISSGAAFNFTACPGGLTKTEVRSLGITGQQPSGQQFTVAAAQVTITTNGGVVLGGIQVVCWK